MLDAALCEKLLSRIPTGARLIFLGDPEQLAPIEPGDPFCHIIAACHHEGKLSQTMRTDLQPLLELASYVRTGEDEKALQFLTHSQNVGIFFKNVSKSSLAYIKKKSKIRKTTFLSELSASFTSQCGAYGM